MTTFYKNARSTLIQAISFASQDGVGVLVFFSSIAVVLWSFLSLDLYANLCSHYLPVRASYCSFFETYNRFLIIPDLIILFGYYQMFSKKEEISAQYFPIIIGVPVYLFLRVATAFGSSAAHSSGISAFFLAHYNIIGFAMPAGIIALSLLIAGLRHKGEFVTSNIEEQNKEPQENGEKIACTDTPSNLENLTGDLSPLEAHKARVIFSIKTKISPILDDIFYDQFPSVTWNEEEYKDSSGAWQKKRTKIGGIYSLGDVKYVDSDSVLVELKIGQPFIRHISVFKGSKAGVDSQWTGFIHARGEIYGFESAEWYSQHGINGLLLKVSDYSIDFGKTYDFPNIDSQEQIGKHPMDFVMGIEQYGTTPIYNLAKMPHVLIAGQTGSGKSVGETNILVSFMKNILAGCPIDEIIIVDPKQTEFTMYMNLPRIKVLTGDDMVVLANQTLAMLQDLFDESERRYSLFAEAGARNIDEYRAKGHKIGYKVLLIDELADLMLGGSVGTEKMIEVMLARFTAKARASGFHLIVATQRPTVNVITGLIKSNIPARIGFGVATDIDARVIVDEGLPLTRLGGGEFYYKRNKERVHMKSFYIDTEQLEEFVRFYKEEYAKKFVGPQGVSIHSPVSSEHKKNIENILTRLDSYALEKGLPVSRNTFAYLLFKHLVLNSGYKNQQEVRSLRDGTGITRDTVDAVISAIRKADLIEYSETKKTNTLSFDLEDRASLLKLYHIIFNATLGK